MKVIYVDDEYWMVKRFEMECKSIENIHLLATFEDPHEAIEFAKKQKIHCAFLDVDMMKMNGLDLSDRLRKIYPDIIIVYVSAHSEYMAEAFKNRGADYYLLKPYSSKELRDVVERVELLQARQKKTIYIETFGNFNVYIDGKFLDFNSRVAKEILALLVDRRGTAMTNKDLFWHMWEELPCTHENMSRVRKGIQRLRNFLLEAGISEILISSRGNHRVDITTFECDYYEFLDNDENVMKKYQGKYMLEYSWAEETNAILNEKYMERRSY